MTYVPLPRALPHECGVDPRGIVDFHSAVSDAGLELHSFMLYRQGSVVAEAFWRPYSARRMHEQHSATKSWTAFGLLVDDKRLKLSDKVVSFFPELCPVEVSANLAAMTVEDLLTMRTGHQLNARRAGLHRRLWCGKSLRIPARVGTFGSLQNSDAIVRRFPKRA